MAFELETPVPKLSGHLIRLQSTQSIRGVQDRDRLPP